MRLLGLLHKEGAGRLKLSETICLMSFGTARKGFLEEVILRCIWSFLSYSLGRLS
jgi:hypothetical protein